MKMKETDLNNVNIIMKANLFIKPNLKLFFLAALILIVAKELVVPADSGTMTPKLPVSLLEGRSPSQSDMDQLIDYAMIQPTSVNYLILSEGYRKRGDYKQAMRYLRKAKLAEEIE